MRATAADARNALTGRPQALDDLRRLLDVARYWRTAARAEPAHPERRGGDGMTVVGFTISFYGPFRVGAAYARDGVDAALDEHDPLPADHLKGVMRAAAVSLLGTGEDGGRVVAEVFGSARTPSPWSWSSATLDSQAGQQWSISRRHRVEIDPDTHSAIKDHLVLGEQAWAPAARFQVSRVGLLDAGALAEARSCAGLAVRGRGRARPGRLAASWAGLGRDHPRRQQGLRR